MNVTGCVAAAGGVDRVVGLDLVGAGVAGAEPPIPGQPTSDYLDAAHGHRMELGAG